MPGAAEVKRILDAETAYLAAGNPPRAFYHPGRSANGHLDRGKFIRHEVPAGFALDVEAWEEAGRTGEAPLKPL